MCACKVHKFRQKLRKDENLGQTPSFSAHGCKMAERERGMHPRALCLDGRGGDDKDGRGFVLVLLRAAPLSRTLSCCTSAGSF